MNLQKDMFYVTEFQKLNRLSFSDLKTVNIIYEKNLFDNSKTTEKIIIILQYIGDNIFKEILTNIQIQIEPKHEMEDTVLNGNDFNNVFNNYKNGVLFVSESNIKKMTELDKIEFLKINHTNLKQLLIKIDKITKQQFLNEITDAKIYENEIIILSAGENVFNSHSKRK